MIIKTLTFKILFYLELVVCMGAESLKITFLRLSPTFMILKAI
jgi:hypothetical protein